ncbi:MAG: zf-HC2 domain-containing protein [Chloroflexota bacterium]|nr:zf-HC2 domain-containing protein [Chloroflexota bacterium]
MTMRRGPHPDELISASLTDDLTYDERAELDRHLAGCAACRETLAAFTVERDLVAGMREVEPPRNLAARVRTGIEAGRLEQRPWWRRGGGLAAAGGFVATVGAAALAVLLISNLPLGPVGQGGSPQPTASATASDELSPSEEPSASATPPATTGDVALEPGQVGYLSLVGAPFSESHLYFINDANGASVEAQAPSGPILSAAFSPTNEWLAYITQKGESGANEVWALRIADGTTLHLGCSLAAPFTDRLAWSPDGSYLAYTLVADDLGASSGCPANDRDERTTDAWIFEAPTGEHYHLTQDGDAFAASFLAGETPTLLVSHAAEAPWSEAVPLATTPSDLERIDGVFMPLVSPDGNRALFWRGTMALEPGGWAWSFSRGGMPYVSGDFRSSGPASPWLGEQLFADLTTPGGAAFAAGRFSWGLDSDLVAFWGGAWNGTPQGGQGTYPDDQGVYIGRIGAGLLTVDSRLSNLSGSIGEQDWIVDVIFTADGGDVVVTVGLPSAGIGDPPSSRLLRVPLDGGDATQLGGDSDPTPWNGPAVIGRLNSSG